MFDENVVWVVCLVIFEVFGIVEIKVKGNWDEYLVNFMLFCDSGGGVGRIDLFYVEFGIVLICLD